MFHFEREQSYEKVRSYFQRTDESMTVSLETISYPNVLSQSTPLPSGPNAKAPALLALLCLPSQEGKGDFIH